MTLSELLDELSRRGAQVWAEGEKLRVRAPAGAVTAELKAALERLKPDLLARLGEEPAAGAPISSSQVLAGEVPLGPAQQGLWLLHRMAPASLPAYNIRSARRLEGPVEIDLLRRAFDQVVRRHPQLRARFQVVDERPVQRIAPSCETPFERVDLRDRPAAEQEAVVRRAVDEEGRFAFDLARAPLFRMRLFQLGEESFFLLLNAHHLIADAVSAGVILRDLAAVYRALAAGEPSPLPPLEHEYADYVRWQRRWLAGEGAAQVAAWKEELARLPVLELPTDRRRPPVQSYEGASESFDLPPELARELRRLGREEGATLFMGLLAALAVLLHRFSGQDDLPVGASVAGRERSETAGLVGFFVNLVVLRCRLEGEPSFRRLLGRVRQTALAAFARQEVPFDLLVKELKPERRLDRHPLFQVLFLFLPPEREDPFAELGLRTAAVQLPSVTSKFDLTLQVEEQGEEGLRCLVEYRTDLFDAATVHRFIAAYRRLLEAAVAEPDRSVAELLLLGAEERRRLLEAGGRLRHRPPPEETLQRWFARRAGEAPDRVAVTAEDRAVTYGALGRRAGALSGALRRRGVGPEDRVGICLPRSEAMVTAVLGVLGAGGAYVPIDPGYPEERRSFMLADSGARLLLDDGVLAELTGPEPDAYPVDAHATGDHAAYVIYTSGSTGQPKGVVVTHRNVTRLFTAAGELFSFGPEEVWTLFHSLAFDFSVWEIWGALLHGGRVVVVPYLVSRSPGDFHRRLVEEGVTVLSQTPSAFRSLVAWEESAAGATPSSVDPLRLRYVVFGGEALDPAMLAPWFDRHGDRRPELVNMFGITETTVHVTHRRLERRDAAGEGGSVIGRRLPDLALYLLDRRGRPVPPGVAGELHVGGAGVARGYLGRPGLTAGRFVPDPFGGEPGARLYRTGDLGRLRPGEGGEGGEEGEVEYLGRVDFQVKVRGFRIELGEIESVLASHPAVAACTVLAWRGEGESTRLVAYLVPRGEGAEPSALRRHLEERLPDHMVPAAFVPLAELPLTHHGKVDRRALPEPDWGEAVSRREYAPPRTPYEEILARAWSEVLGVERVGIDDNFFALGGDSILSLEVVARAARRGLRLTLQEIYRAQTIRALAPVLEVDGLEPGAPGREEAPVPETLEPFALLDAGDRDELPADAQDAYPLTSLQAGMFYHSERAPESAVFHDIFSYRLRSPWDEAAWRRAFQDLLAAHPVLRTSFHWSGFSRPLQIVHRVVPEPLEVDDLRRLGEEEQAGVVRRGIEEEKRHPFVPEHAPLLRARLQRLDEEVHQLTVSFHHAILDGWSTATLVNQLLGLYLHHLGLGGRPETAPEASAFRDYVLLERRAAEDPELAGAWRRELAGLAETRLPRLAGEPAPADSPRIVHHPVVFDQGLSPRLFDLARSWGLPLKTLLLAAHLRVLALLAGRDRVVSGYVINGRPETEGSRNVLGLFLNTVPLGVALPGGTWEELAREVFRREREILPLRRYPLAEIKRLNGGRDPFEVNFDFVHFHVYRGLEEQRQLEILEVETFEETEALFLAQFSAHPASGEIELVLAYDEGRFSGVQVERYGGTYRRALAALAGEPQVPWREASLLTEAERRELLQPAGPVPGLSGAGEPACGELETAGTLVEAFHRVARRRGSQPAVSAGDGRSRSYGELAEAADRLARRLRSRGLSPGQLVGLRLLPSPELVEGMLGILAAGGAYLPLDPALPADHRRRLLADLRPRWVVTQPELLGELGSFDGEVVLLGDGKAPVEGVTLPALLPEQPACLVDRSGSIVQPEGCLLSHATLLQQLASAAGWLGGGPEDVCALSHSCAFEPSLWEIWGTLLSGGRLAVPPADGAASPQAFLEWLAAREVTVLHQTGAAFRRLVAADETSLELLRLRMVVIGGEPLEPAVLASWLERHVEDEPRLVAVPSGPATTCHVTLRPLTARDAAGPPGAGGSGGPGRRVEAWPMPGHRVVVLGPGMELAPLGSPGALHAGGEWVGLGFPSRPALTAGRFLPDPSSDRPGGRLYATGDRARRLPGGRLELVTAREGRAPGLPGPEAAVEEVAYVPPRDELEERLVALFAQVLKVEEVGVRHDFFDLGGDSILATQLVSRLRRAFSIELPLRVLFESPRIEELARVVRAAPAAPAAGKPALTRAPSSLSRVRVSADGQLLEVAEGAGGTGLEPASAGGGEEAER